jgi:hypothetical protein
MAEFTQEGGAGDDGVDDAVAEEDAGENEHGHWSFLSILAKGAKGQGRTVY